MSGSPPWGSEKEAEHITRIRVLFTVGLPERVRKMREGFQQLAVQEEGGAIAGMRQLFMEAHRLAGSAESFGGARLGEAAARIDQLLRNSYDLGVLPSAEVVEALPGLLSELGEAEREFCQWMEGEMVREGWREEGSGGGRPVVEGE